jgi:two-component system, cell cycle sensor histidine kinase and response regulator CckA
MRSLTPMSISVLRPRSAPGWVGALLALQAGLAVAYALLLLEADSLFGLDVGPDSWWPLGVLSLGALISLAARAAGSGPERAPWIAFSVAAAGWTWGFLSWAALYGDDPSPPYPSLSDLGWLVFQPMMILGIGLLLRSERLRANTNAWLDAAIPAFAVGALASQILLPNVSTSGEDLFGKLTLLAYPALDVVLIAVAMLALALRKWEAGARWDLLLVVVFTSALGDMLWSFQVASGEHQAGGVADLPWLVAAVAIAHLPWTAAPHPITREEDRPLRLTLPMVAAVGALVLLLHGVITGELTAPVLVLALASVGTGVVRWSLAVRKEAQAAVLRNVAAELGRKADQQAAVADLGARAIATADADEMMRSAAEVVATILDAERVAVLELAAGAEELVLHADSSGLDGDPQLVALGLAALDAGTPTVLMSDALVARIERKDGSWGVIVVLRPGAGSFGDDDMSFVQAVANVLGAVVARSREVQLEAQLQQARRLESVGKLAGGVAHDFNNLLAIILNYADFAREAATDEEQRRDLEELSKAATRGAELVRQLLQFSRRRPVDATAVDITEVIRDTEPMLRRAAGEQIKLRCWLASELPPTLIDHGQLTQVLMNLVVNARDAMPDGGTLTIKATQSGESAVQLAVEDTGQGMDAATVAKAFDPFFTTKPPGSGTGLGLATVYGIVTQADGGIELDSEPGRGTRVVIELPCGEAALVSRRSGERPAAAEPGRGETILVVEDDVQVRGIAGRILREHGYHVLEACGGAEALRVAEGAPHPIDMLVSDVVMPGMSGPELAGRLRELRPDLPVLHMSGYSSGIASHDPGGLPDLIEKPFSAADLLARVRQLLGDEVSAPAL